MVFVDLLDFFGDLLVFLLAYAFRIFSTIYNTLSVGHEDNHRAVLLDNASLLRVPGSPGTYKDGESEIAILHL